MRDLVDAKVMFKLIVALIPIFLPISLALAETTNMEMLLGYWGTSLPNGKGVIYHFTRTKMIASLYDESRNFVAEELNTSVKYMPFLQVAGIDQSIGIEFDNGGGFLATFKDSNRVYLDFMGTAADEAGNTGGHFLVRLSAKSPHRPVKDKSF